MTATHDDQRQLKLTLAQTGPMVWTPALELLLHPQVWGIIIAWEIGHDTGSYRDRFGEECI